MPETGISIWNITSGDRLPPDDAAVIKVVMHELSGLFRQVSLPVAFLDYDRVRSTPLTTLRIPLDLTRPQEQFSFELARVAEGHQVNPALEPYATTLKVVTDHLLTTAVAQLYLHRATMASEVGTEPWYVNSGYGSLINGDKLLIEPVFRL